MQKKIFKKLHIIFHDFLLPRFVRDWWTFPFNLNFCSETVRKERKTENLSKIFFRHVQWFYECNFLLSRIFFNGFSVTSIQSPETIEENPNKKSTSRDYTRTKFSSFFLEKNCVWQKWVEKLFSIFDSRQKKKQLSSQFFENPLKQVNKRQVNQVEPKLVIYWRKIHYFNIPRFNGKFILFLGKDDESSRWKIINFCFLMGKFNKWKLWVFISL
jgi:hypothetical protein